jgi:hypothetical protein
MYEIEHVSILDFDLPLLIVTTQLHRLPLVSPGPAPFNYGYPPSPPTSLTPPGIPASFQPAVLTRSQFISMTLLPHEDS